MINVSMIEKSSYSDTMSRRSSHRGVSFVEDIEMDSLEPEINFVCGKSVLLPIKENEIEFLVASVDAFKEFDVSFKEKRNKKI